ncbi:ubiquitin ligase e3 alpha-related [Anaeramoeba flamelloides]|uniref:E3 ubiquitin-protein ligase n=1 Tax=Anaeramoeba flamelloides TaxID=1746091 RepID=A0AAV7YWJ7_9EUKA|nr:ubiquitin ligase e3 alpha-related [Anaeramoeba flamelloides]
MEFDKLVKLPKYECCLKVLESTEQIQPFVEYLITTISSTKEISQWLHYLITASENPNKFYQKLKQEGEKNSGSCSKSWSGDGWFYNCKTCQLDKTSCLCIECFKNGNHEGHDYRLVGGCYGMCDCGDPQSWKPSGWCKNHKGPPEHPEELLEKNFRERLSPIFQSICKYFYELINKRINHGKNTIDYNSVVEKKSNQEAHIELSKFLSTSKFCLEEILEIMKIFDILDQGGAGTRRVGGQVMYSYKLKANGNEKKKEEEKTFLYYFMKFTNIERGTIYEKIRDFLYKMMVDLPFKFEFLKIYMELFPKMMDRVSLFYNPSVSYCELTEFSVQLFTVPAFVEKLCTEMNHLETFFTTMANILESAMVSDEQEAENMVLDLKHPTVVNRKLYRISNDLTFILSDIWTCQYAIMKDNYMFELFVNIYSMLQGMNQFKKISQAPQEFIENDKWIQSYTLESDLYELPTLIVLGLLAGENKIEKATKSIESLKPGKITKSLIKKIVEVYDLMVDDILHWVKKMNKLNLDLKEKSYLLNQSKDQNKNYLIYDFDFTKNNISFHFPIHRMLSLFISSALKFWKSDPKKLNLFTIFKKSIINEDKKEEKEEEEEEQEEEVYLNNFLPIIIHIIRLQSICSEIRLDLWKKNGTNINRQADFQRLAIFSTNNIDNDLFLLQVATILMDPNLMLLNCLNEFNLIDYISLGQPKILVELGEEKNKEVTEEVRFQKSLVTVEFLRLILNILLERNNSGFLTDHQKLEREIIHVLAISPSKFSTLVRSIPNSLLEDLDENILEEITFKVANLNKEKGILTLKKEYWKKFEGQYFPHYTKRQAELAEERYYKFLEIENKNLSKEKQVPIRHPIPEYEAPLETIKNVPKIINNHLFYQILFSLLYNSIIEDGIYNEELLETVLHCIYYLLAIPYKSSKIEEEEEEEFRMEINENDNGFNEIKFQDPNNFLKNVSNVIKTAKGEYSFVILLIKILDDEQRKPLHSLVHEILKKLYNQKIHNKEIISQKIGNVLKLNNNLEEKNVNEESEIEKRKRLIREKQKTMMEEMNKKQSKIIEKYDLVLNTEKEKEEKDKQNEENEEKENEKEKENESITSLNDQEYTYLNYDEHCQYLTCSLCHETFSKTKEKPIAMMAFITEKNQIQKKLSQDVEELFCLGRSHLIHVECYQNYLSNLLKRKYERQWYEGIKVANLSKFEFLNPLNRKIVNTIIPLIIFPKSDLNETTNKKKKKISLVTDYQNVDLFKNSLEAIEPLIDFETQLISQSLVENSLLFESINSFVGRLGIVKSTELIETPEQSEAGYDILFNLFSNTITGYELLTRLENNHDLNSVNRFSLQTIFRICCVFGKRNNAGREIIQKIKFQIWDFLINSHTTESLSHIYDIDLFNLIIKFYCLLSNEISNEELFFHIIRLIIPFFILQILYKLELIEMGLDELQEAEIIKIQSHLIPFLRSLLIFYKNCIDQEIQNSKPLSFAIIDYQKLCELLHLPTDFKLFLKSESITKLIKKWKEIKNEETIKDIQIRKILPLKDFLQMDFPQNFNELWYKYQNNEKFPKSLCMCLLTGQLLNMKTKENSDFINAKEYCNLMGGNGLNLSITGIYASGMILNADDIGLILMKGFYLDKWNEPDFGLKRGKSLLFNKEILLEYFKSYFDHTIIDQLIIFRNLHRRMN